MRYYRAWTQHMTTQLRTNRKKSKQIPKSYTRSNSSKQYNTTNSLVNRWNPL